MGALTDAGAFGPAFDAQDLGDLGARTIDRRRGAADPDEEAPPVDARDVRGQLAIGRQRLARTAARRTGGAVVRHSTGARGPSPRARTAPATQTATVMS